jgi:thiamine-phosphate pyrophosphorylase
VPSLQPSVLYGIVDAEVCARGGLTVPALARAQMRGGARVIQLRAKTASSAAFLAWCDEVVRDARERGVQVIVNDRADLAVLAGADGVHVGQEDLPVSAVRRVAGASAIVGLSTHTAGQIAAALEQPIDYLAVGPIFGTLSKDTGYRPVGLELVRHAARAAGNRPVVAIGGITLERAAAVLAAGAAAVAVISDLLATGDPEARTREYLDALRPFARR